MSIGFTKRPLNNETYHGSSSKVVLLSVIVFPTSMVSFVLTPVSYHGSFNLSGVILDFRHVSWRGESKSRLTDIPQRRSGGYLREVVV